LSLPLRSLADRPGLLILLAATLLTVVWSCQPLVHDDIFWHIRAGEWIAHHHRVPLVDGFSFTRAGSRWITHEWGFSCLAAIAYRWDGFLGIFVATALAMLGIGSAVYRRCEARDTWGATTAAAGLGLSLLAVRSLVFLRPALIGEVCFALALVALDRYRRTSTLGSLVLLGLIFWVWANIHSGVIFGLFVLGLQAIESVLPAKWTGDVPASPRRRWVLPSACAAIGALCLLNPNGLDALRFPFLLNKVFFHSGIEWDLGQFEGYSPLKNTPLMLLTLALLVGWLRRSPRSRPRLWEIAAIATFFLLSLRASRFMFSLVILMVPVVVRLWSRAAEEHDTRSAVGARWAVAAILAATLGIFAWRSGLSWPPRALDRSLPAGPARFLEAQGLHGHMFHHANHGGYLYFALGEPIFWDGRNDVFWTLTREVTTTDFSVIRERYGVDILVLTEREYSDMRSVVEGGDWGLVYWDDSAAVYLARSRFAPRLGELELHQFLGFGGNPAEVNTLAAQPATAAAAHAELQRLLSFWPENQRALYLLGVLDFYTGDLEASRDALNRALALGPNDVLEKTLAAVERAAANRR
jgi:hypothetical protein